MSVPTLRVTPSSSSSSRDSVPTSFFIYKVGDAVNALHGKSGTVIVSGSELGHVLNSIGNSGHLQTGDHITFQSDIYQQTTEYVNSGQARVTYQGNGSIIGGKWTFYSNPHTHTVAQPRLMNFQFSGRGAGVEFDSLFGASLEDCDFENCSGGVIISSSVNYAELWQLDNVHFNNCKTSLQFKSPISGGVGSYINGTADHVTFNTQGNAFMSGTDGYTFIEVQGGAQIDQCRFPNMRLWFNGGSGIGYHQMSGGSAVMCLMYKPFFENFAGASGRTIGMLIDAGGSLGTVQFYGRPIFAGSPYFREVINSGNRPMHGLNAVWRDADTVTIGQSGSFGAVRETMDFADVVGLPNMAIVIGGTIQSGETITVKSEMIQLGQTSGTSFARTKTYTSGGVYPFDQTDYFTYASNSYSYVPDHLEVSAHSNFVSSGTVTIFTMDGGTLVPQELSGRKLTSIDNNSEIPVKTSESVATAWKSGSNVTVIDSLNGSVIYSGTNNVSGLMAGVNLAHDRGKFFIQPGTYNLESELNLVDKNVLIVGEVDTGGGANRTRPGDTTLVKDYSGMSGFINIVNTVFSKQMLEKINIQNASGYSGQGIGIDSYDSRERTFLKNVRVTDFDIGLRLQRSVYCDIYDVAINNCKTAGVYMIKDIGANTAVNTTKFFGGRIINCGTNLIAEGAHDTQFFATVMENGVSGCVLTTSGSDNMSFHNVSMEVVEGSGKTLIHEHGNSNAYEGCRFGGSGNQTIIRFYSESRNTQFVGNYIGGSHSGKDSIIQVDPGASGCIIANNVTRTNTPVTLTIVNSGNAKIFNNVRAENTITERTNFTSGIRLGPTGSGHTLIWQSDNAVILQNQDGSDYRDLGLRAINVGTIRDSGANSLAFLNSTSWNFNDKTLTKVGQFISTSGNLIFNQSGGTVNFSKTPFTSGAIAGGNGAVPATALGYMVVQVSGSNVKVPFFAV